MDKKLNNLLCMKDFSLETMFKKSKSTKKTEVAKDILESAEVIINGKLNNLISLDDFSKEITAAAKKTKRTETGKDVINEKKVDIEEDDDDDVIVKEKGKKDKKNKKEKCDKKCDDDYLTPAQRKLPEGLKKSLIAKAKAKK